MWQFLKKYKKEVIIGPLFKFLEVCFDLAVPILMANVIDIGIANNDTEYIIRTILIIMAFGVIGFSCTVVAQYFAAKASVGITASIKTTLYQHIQALSTGQLDQFSTSSLISRLTNDTNQIQNGLNLFFRLILRSPVVVVGATIMAYLRAPNLTVIFLITILILTAIIIVITQVTIPKYGTVQQQLDKVLTKVKDNLAGVRILRAFRKQNSQIEEFEQSTNDLCKQQISVSNIANILNPLTYAIVNVAIILIIYFGSFSIQAGTLSTGSLIAVYNYMSQILVELVKLVNLIMTLTKAYASYQRIDAVLQTETLFDADKVSQTTDSSASQIVFDHVSFVYPNASEESLKDISFEIKAGQSVGIIGSTGSGKSTLTSLLCRYYDASEGTIRLYGNPIQNYPVSQLRSLVSNVFQKATLLSGTVRSNMLMAKPDASDEEIWQALKKAQVDDVVEGNLDKEVLQAGSNFSGGQRQRLTLAQAFLRNNEILVLDDATSALDFKTESLIRSELSKSQATTISVSQRVNSLSHCDLILVLDDGRLVGQGTHEQLLQTCPTYLEIYKSQTKGGNE